MEPRTARLIAPAKLNLGLRVLYKRPDGFHELRTLFQTISLADTITVSYAPGRGSEVTLDSELKIPNNLIVRAAEALLEETGARGRVHFSLKKRIPMGGGLGGGSTNAAAVLLGLPALLGKRVPINVLSTIGAKLGSDIPFFLYGGRALGLGRGTELYPLPDGPAEALVLVVPGFPVATPDAYRALSARLASDGGATARSEFEAELWQGEGRRFFSPKAAVVNDFEPVVFQQFPELIKIQKKLARTGASPAGMTGSGSTMYGVYESPAAAAEAVARLKPWQAIPAKTITRSAYRKMWLRQLHNHVDSEAWPPRSKWGK